MHLSHVTTFVMALTLPAAGASAAELIVNGGFETGSFTAIGGAITTYDLISAGDPAALTGWSAGNSLVWGLNTTDINTHTGQGFVDLTGVGDTRPHGILNQTIATIIGQQYSFSVFATQDFTGSTGFSVFANAISLVLSGTPGFWDYTPTGATYGQLSSVFTADATSTTISIVGATLGSRQFMIGLDDVSVTGPVPATVPVPAGLPLLAAGLGALAALRRRTRV